MPPSRARATPESYSILKSETKRRADVLLVEQGLAETRTRAQALILAGAVVDAHAQRIDKPGAMLASSTVLRLKEQPLPYVSRGGLKLAAALQRFEVAVQGAICLDVGASTGGFTDCLLQAGAAKVYALDVGYGQLAWSLRQDPRVVVLERCNIRSAPDTLIAEPCGLMVIDVSFISLRLVLPPALRFTSADAQVVALVKPQFEVGRADIGKGGIVRDAQARQRALDEIYAEMGALGLGDLQSMESPIVGAKGNHEFLLSGRRRILAR